MPEPRKIGLIVGAESSFPEAFLAEVNGRGVGVVGELVRLGAPKMGDPVPYAVVIDRMSHEVPFYRTYLKHAVLHGCLVVNNPFMWSADDKFFGATLADRLGIHNPRTLMLPHKEYVPGLVHERSLRNLEYPLDWQGVIDYVGLPCVLKDAHGGGWRDVHLCHSLDELLFHYNESGRLLMIAQEYIRWDRFVRAICIGRDDVLPIDYDPTERRYRETEAPLDAALHARIVEDSRRLMKALGYDMNSIEWAVRDGIPYAVDLMNPAPDFDDQSLPAVHFQWAVRKMADLATRLAHHARPSEQLPGWAVLGGEGSPDLSSRMASTLRSSRETGRPGPDR